MMANTACTASYCAMHEQGITEAVSNLNERIEKGVSEQEVKSAVSGIEQQLNAAKATAGLD